MAIITISRQFGAGGRTMGKRLAQRLGYRYVNEEMIKKVAEKTQVSPEGVSYFEKSGGSKLHRFMEKVVTSTYLDRILGGSYRTINEDAYLNVVTEILEDIYREDNAVIIGRGGQYILRRKPDVVHVLLVGDYSDRVEFVEVKYNLTTEAAVTLVQRADEDRKTFLDMFGRRYHDDPNNYTICINTSKVGMDVAEELILKCLGTNGGQHVLDH